MCACLGLVEAKMPGLDDLGGVPVRVQRDDVGAVDMLEEIVLIAKCGVIVVVVMIMALVATAVVVFVRHVLLGEGKGRGK